MINLEIIKEKLENLLNGVDDENTDVISPMNDRYFFQVACEGFNLQQIYDMKSGKNFMPVFVSSVGGNFNPIPKLKEIDYSFQLQFFFPVRFKNDFYTTVSSFLMETFVGKVLTYNGEKAVSNISVPTYNEIDDASVKEFQNFLITNYKRPITITEKWLSMVVVLYVSQVGNDYILGNDCVATLSCEIDGEEYTQEVVFAETGITTVSNPTSEQLQGDNTTESIIATTTYGTGFAVYVSKSEFYKKVIGYILEKKAQLLKPHLRIDIPSLELVYETDCIFTNTNLTIKKGEPLSLSLNIADRKV